MQSYRRLHISHAQISGIDECLFFIHPDNVKLWLFSYSSVYTYVLGAQKNHVIETFLLSTHNIRFGLEIQLNLS